MFLLAEAMAVAGERLGLPLDLSVHLARKTVSGGCADGCRTKIEAAQLYSNVTSEGGTTAAALAVLQAEDGLQLVFDRLLRAAFDRGRELDS